MIELEGQISGLSFKPEGKEKNVVATISIKCQPNELEAGRLSRLAGKDVEITISSRQIPLPLRSRQEQPEQPAHVVTDLD